MSPQSDRSQFLELAQTEHVLLALSIWNFRRLFTGDRPPDAAQQFTDIQQFITQKLAGHFADEESRIFPVLLADHPWQMESQVLAELRQDHMRLLTKARQLNALLHRINLAKCTGELWTALRDFLADMEQHVAKEDQLFAAEYERMGGTDKAGDRRHPIAARSIPVATLPAAGSPNRAAAAACQAIG